MRHLENSPPGYLVLKELFYDCKLEVTESNEK